MNDEKAKGRGPRAKKSAMTSRKQSKVVLSLLGLRSPFPQCLPQRYLLNHAFQEATDKEQSQFKSLSLSYQYN